MKAGSEQNSITRSALEALARGYQPVPIKRGTKRPQVAGWTHRRYDEESVKEAFDGDTSLGLVLGEPSGGLIDVDIDHPISWRIASMFLPQTRMRSGRVGNPNSHYWYRVTDTVPGYRKYTLPGGDVAVELRSSGHQTLIPPSVHTSGEAYRWEAEPWGGEQGPTEIPAKQLTVRVASLALASVLVENWPEEGSRHDAYLALAGGMLRFGDEGVHPYWARALPQLIEALAEATHDEDGARTRVGEVVPTTEAKLQVGSKVQGWTTLSGILGEETVNRARTLVREIEGIVDWKRHLPLPSTNEPLIRPDRPEGQSDDDPDETDLPAPISINPLDARTETWEPVNLEPYLAGEVVVPEPSILRRSDGKGIFYPGRVNSMYGRSESAKSWVALHTCIQEISIGERVLYVDLEDDPAMTLKRLRLMGAGDDDIRYQFMYLRPEGPHSKMQRDTWGNERPTELGHKNAALFAAAVEKHDPGLIVVDGMSVLYGLHGLNTNDVASTDVITNWLKSTTRNGRSTTIVIDHTSKGAEKGAMPIGSQHKVSMVQGTAIQVVPVAPPRPGALGHVELVVGKDRPGGVREISSADKYQIAADVLLDSRTPGITQVAVLPPGQHNPTLGASERQEARLAKVNTLRDSIWGVLHDHLDNWLSPSQIKAAMVINGYTDNAFKKALDQMIAEGEIEHNGKRGVGSQYLMKSIEKFND